MKKATPAIRNFLVFFGTVAFVSSCCLILFIQMLQDTIGREFTREEITLAAKLTMINVIFISVGMACIDHIRRKMTVERPVREIVAAAEQIIAGDFRSKSIPYPNLPQTEAFTRSSAVSILWQGNLAAWRLCGQILLPMCPMK